MLKPPISRMGGKSRLRKQIIELIPEHTCYVEVFFGAGWVYFGKEASKVEVINDIDSEVSNLFTMIKNHEEEIQRLLRYEICSRDFFTRYIEINPIHLTEIQRAVRFLYLISQSFGAKGSNYGYAVTKPPNYKIFNINLKEIKDRLRNTYVENLDFDVLIKKYDKEHTVFYCDPPYYKTAGYKKVFTVEDHIRLRDTLNNIEGKFILTINDLPETRKWYNGYNIIETEVLYTVSGKGNQKKAKELIIKNF